MLSVHPSDSSRHVRCQFARHLAPALELTNTAARPVSARKPPGSNCNFVTALRRAAPVGWWNVCSFALLSWSDADSFLSVSIRPGWFLCGSVRGRPTRVSHPPRHRGHDLPFRFVVCLSLPQGKSYHFSIWSLTLPTLFISCRKFRRKCNFQHITVIRQTQKQIKLLILLKVETLAGCMSMTNAKILNQSCNTVFHWKGIEIIFGMPTRHDFNNELAV